MRVGDPIDEDGLGVLFQLPACGFGGGNCTSLEIVASRLVAQRYTPCPLSGSNHIAGGIHRTGP